MGGLEKKWCGFFLCLCFWGFGDFGDLGGPGGGPGRGGRGGKSAHFGFGLPRVYPRGCENGTDLSNY